MKRLVVAGVIFILLNAHSHAAIGWGGAGKCQILDKTPLPIYTLSGAYFDEADIEGGTDTALFELDANWGCGYYHDKLSGDIDTHFQLGAVFFIQTASLDLPTYVAEVSFDIAWIHRMQNGISAIVGLTPGFYSDFENLDGDGFFLPVRAAAVKTFNRRVSAIAGLEFRSGFDRELFPIIGIAWQPDHSFRLEAGLPQSLIQWAPDNEWSFYAKFVWSNMSYNLRQRDNDNRERLTLEDYRNVFGLQRLMDDQMGVFFDVGRSYRRSIVFERRNDSSLELEMDRALFLRCGVSGYF